MDVLKPADPDAILFTGGECARNTRGVWPFTWQGKHELVVDHALGRVIKGQKVVKAAVLRCKHCGVHLRLECLTGPEK